MVLTSSQMATWWQSSPYYDVGFYPYGSAATHSHINDPTLNKSWVAAVAAQGWGLMPIWSGPQAPCGCKNGVGKYPNCTLWPHSFSATPAAAKTQGALRRQVQSRRSRRWDWTPASSMLMSSSTILLRVAARQCGRIYLDGPSRYIRRQASQVCTEIRLMQLPTGSPRNRFRTRFGFLEVTLQSPFGTWITA